MHPPTGRREPDAPPDRVREFLAGNLCRCGGYDTILAAVLAARPPKGS